MNNLDLMNKRLQYQGGNQEQRMIKDKYNTFKKALLYSYQSAEVRKEEETEIRKALINPNKAKTDYDDKILSIDYAFGFKPGDIFEWMGTSTYWIIYIRQLTEDAYFRAEIRRCKYQIQWIDTDSSTKKTTWAYIRGPVETKINSIQKSGISVDVPNWSLELYVQKNEQNLKKFKRYSRFLFDGRAWEVQVADSISMEGVIQVIALEHFANTVLDNKEEDLVDYFKVLPVSAMEQESNEINGEVFIKPRTEYTYTTTLSNGYWYIKESKRPVSLVEQDDGSVKLSWTAMMSGQFTLVYNDNNGTEIEKIIVSESLF